MYDIIILFFMDFEELRVKKAEEGGTKTNFFYNEEVIYIYIYIYIYYYIVLGYFDSEFRIIILTYIYNNIIYCIIIHTT